MQGVWENGIYRVEVNGLVCTFDEEKHRYSIDGLPAPGVTGVLRAKGYIDDRFWNEEALLRGQYFHKATEYYDEGTLDWDALDPVLIPYMEGYPKWLERYEVEILASEFIGFNTTYRYGGRGDRIVSMKLPKQSKRIKALIDYKSGGYASWCELQTGGYVPIIPEGIVDPGEYLHRFGVQFTARGEPILHPHKDLNDTKLFLSEAAGYHWQRNKLRITEDSYDGSSSQFNRVA